MTLLLSTLLLLTPLVSTPALALLAIAIGLVASIAGGAAGGLMIGSKDLGKELSAMMGGFFGPLAGVGGIVLGLIITAFIS